MKTTTSDRLKQIMSEKNLKQVDILTLCQPYCNKYSVNLKKNDLSQYVSGKVQPGQDKLTILGLALDVNECWLMGYSVPQARDGLQTIEKKMQEQEATCNLFEKCYGQLAYQAASMFLELDQMDQGIMIGEMRQMLKSDKYSLKKESRDA